MHVWGGRGERRGWSSNRRNSNYRLYSDTNVYNEVSQDLRLVRRGGSNSVEIISQNWKEIPDQKKKKKQLQTEVQTIACFRKCTLFNHQEYSRSRRIIGMIKKRKLKAESILLRAISTMLSELNFILWW